MPAAAKPVPDFGPFALDELLGKGGFGVVHRALDRRYQTWVALKRADDAWRGDPGVAEQFRTSAAVSRKVQHPRVCPIFDHGEIDGIPYLTMPIYPRGSLRDARHARNLWDAAAAVQGLAWTLHELHEKGVLHLDLKPENILFNAEDEAVIVDFGCAARFDLIGLEGLRAHKGIGTLFYMAPEQLPVPSEYTQGVEIGPACDVWALGVILYELLAGRRPFTGATETDLAIAILNDVPAPPSRYNRAVPPELDDLCLKALTRRAGDSFPNMEAFANALAAAYDSAGWRKVQSGDRERRPLVAMESIRFLFVGHGSLAPQPMPPDRLFLDVGHDLRPGVIHHQAIGGAVSTAWLVLRHPHYLDAAVAPHRVEGALFTLLLHQEPDLDCVASALFARQYLATGRFPDGAEALANYMDAPDARGRAESPAFRSSLFVAYQVLKNKLLKQPFPTPQERWDAELRGGMALAEAVMRAARVSGRPVAEVDAFAVPGGAGDAGRREVDEDERRYRRLLADPRGRSRAGRLRFPDRHGLHAEADVLLIRDFSDDAGRCELLKVWTQTDTAHSAKGFAVVCVFTPEAPGRPARCTIALKPGAPVTLQGLGTRIEQAEHDRRKRGNLGRDLREYDLMTGLRLPNRPGYRNPDPWYDGHGHDYTRVASPRCGTVLSADDIEGMVLEFGRGAVSPLAIDERA